MDVSVDDIIEKVLIRNENEHYNYTKQPNTKHKHHLLNYYLQEENQNLHQKLSSLLKIYQSQNQRKAKIKKTEIQLQEMKSKLEMFLHQNIQLQQQIDKMRLRKSKKTIISDNFQLSDKRQCSCDVKQKLKSKNSKTISNLLEQSYESHHKGVSCDLLSIAGCNNTLQQKKNHIDALKKIIKQQQLLISSYEQSSKEQKQIEKNTGNIGLIVRRRE